MSVARWGNSLAVRLPREAARAANLEEGATLDLEVAGGALTLRRRRYDIGELVAAIKGAPPPLEMDDPPRGSEAW
ncbi:MAG: AbrB/MazE/SpoVT family DNA-binding domain-containing protein [Caulobacteraceae bacterium]|nr:AbrB/MazE/SpoVT family DNA-binding domain-containing protein [Caulobacteraceae bacterium]